MVMEVFKMAELIFVMILSHLDFQLKIFVQFTHQLPSLLIKIGTISFES